VKRNNVAFLVVALTSMPMTAEHLLSHWTELSIRFLTHLAARSSHLFAAFRCPSVFILTNDVITAAILLSVYTLQCLCFVHGGKPTALCTNA